MISVYFGVLLQHAVAGGLKNALKRLFMLLYVTSALHQLSHLVSPFLRLE